eukprot:PLAT7467.1.p1 GENE.PLAT7467.1~~PLAT7467.1.p1  ORF type:complete len:349 (+),score=165.94 PLAT7467.1:384-1430(+)
MAQHRRLCSRLAARGRAGGGRGRHGGSGGGGRGSVGRSSRGKAARVVELPSLKYMSSRRLVHAAARGHEGVRFVAAQELLDTLGVRGKVDTWVDNLRRFLAAYMRDVLLVRLDQNTEELAAIGLPRDVLLGEADSSKAICPPPGHMTFKSLDDFLRAYDGHDSYLSELRADVDLVVERAELQRFFAMAQSSSFGYVISRVRELAADGCMGSFRFDAGGRWRLRDWSGKKHPTDAQLVMHIFFSYLESLVGSAVLKKHFVETPQRPDSVRSRPLIYLSQQSPPHFKVVVGKAKAWDAIPGAANCFHAMVLFLYQLKLTKSGYLGNMDLSEDLLAEVFDSHSLEDDWMDM